jgi:hypothetical protein
MSRQTAMIAGSLFLAFFFASNSMISTALAQSPAQTSPPAAAAPSQPSTPAAGPQRTSANRLANRASMYYASVWGIEPVSVKLAESGEMVRFTWRVLDPVKAKPLNDKRVNPELIDPQRGISLVVPSVEQVGMLRQAPDKIEEGKTYWMAFANTGRPVKHGDWVVVKIGSFEAKGLIVE